MSNENSENKFVCSKCGSAEIQLFSVAFQSGTSVSTSQTSGMGIGVGSGGGIGVGTYGAVTKTASATLLAGSVAPPEMKKVKGLSVAGIGLFLIACGVSSLFQNTANNIKSGILGIVVGAGVAWIGWYFWKSTTKWNREVYPKLLSEWEHSWICHKCGNTFQIQ